MFVSTQLLNFYDVFSFSPEVSNRELAVQRLQATCWSLPRQRYAFLGFEAHHRESELSLRVAAHLVGDSFLNGKDGALCCVDVDSIFNVLMF